MPGEGGFEGGADVVVVHGDAYCVRGVAAFTPG